MPYVKTRRERRKRPHVYSSAGVAESKQRHAGALKHKGERVPMRAANPPYERPSRKPNTEGKRRHKKRGFFRRKW